MTINETQEAKKKLESQIKKFLNDFEELHKVSISDIKYDWFILSTGYYNNPKDIRISVNI